MASITGTGSLTSSVATLSAAGKRRITASGALSSLKPTVIGSGKRRLTGIGALTASKGTLSANGKRRIHSISAALVGKTPTIASVVSRGVSGSGNLVAKNQVVNSVGVTPDNRIWDQNISAWGDADFIYSEAKPIMLVGNEFYQADNGTMFGEENVQVVLSRTGLTIFGRARDGMWKVDPTTIKEVTGIYPVMRAESGTTVQISIGSQAAPDDPVSWEGPYDFVIGTDFYLDFIVSGRYIGVRFESLGQKPWELLGYDLELKVVGGK